MERRPQWQNCLNKVEDGLYLRNYFLFLLFYSLIQFTLLSPVGLQKILSLLESEDADVQIHAVKVVANLAAEGSVMLFHFQCYIFSPCLLLLAICSFLGLYAICLMNLVIDMPVSQYFG